MAKGSQLTQLKSALSQAGVTSQPKNGKKRKRAGVQQDREKKAAKLNEIQQKLNPFDVKVTKLKHDVGGRKLKGVSGRPAQSKQAGLEQRKKTLLKEYEEKNRSGGIVDRRFGENDPTMTPEERMLERFTKERQRLSKGVAFNLDDEDELTHYGQNLSKMDDFDGVGLTLDDDDDQPDQISRDVVGKTHFGGFDNEEEEDPDQPARKKSKAEVMAEVMAKSKEHKLRRQMEREQGDNVRHELDQEFDSIRSLLYTQDPSSTGSNSIPLGRTRPETNQPSVAEAAAVEEEYDQRVRELAFDKRAKPKDRTKTEEELALEEKEALEKAERKRKRRMMGDESDSDEGEVAEKTRGKRKRERGRGRGGDDLDDDFEGEEWHGLGAGLEEVNEDNDEPSSGSDGDEQDSENDDEDEDESEGEDGSDESDISEAEDGDHEDLIPTEKAGERSSEMKKNTTKELPFTYPCPATHEEFLEIIEDIEDTDIPTVLQRIRALHHPSLGPDNKSKLQTLTTVLIDHILFITASPSPRFTVLLSSIMPHLFTLTRSYPVQSAEHFIKKLMLMHKNLKRGLSRGALDPDAKTWPGLSELCLLRTIGVVWSTSDMNHAVITPTRLLMGAYLGLARVRSLGDIASGLFLCTLFLQFEELSKRFVPEAVNFAVNAVLHLIPHGYKDVSSLPGSFPCPDFRSDICRPLSIDPKKSQGSSVQKPNLADILSQHHQDEQTKLNLLGLALDILGRLAEMYKSLEGFIELYQPVAEILRQVDSTNLPESLQTQVTSLLDTTSRLLKFSIQARRPLLLQSHKPIPIPSYIPKFDVNSSYLRRQDPDHERNEASKLRNQYKQEKKGAIRELRKDARFLAGVEQKKQAEKDREYNMKMKRVMGSLEGERAEEKAMEREKKRAEKRSGRK